MDSPRSVLLTLAPLWIFTAALIRPAAAAPPALPTDAFGREVIGVLWIDAVQLDAAKLKAGVKATFGAHAGLVNEWLGQYERAHTLFVRAGGTSMAILYYDGSLGRESANPIFLFSKSPNANEANIKGVIRGVSNDLAFDSLGDWIVAYQKDLALPFFDRGSALRVQSFQNALRPIATNPIVATFVSNRRQRAGNAKDAHEIKATHEKITADAKARLGFAITADERARINQMLARHQVAHEALTALNQIERIIHEGNALSIAVTLGDKPTISAELMVQDRLAAAEFMKLKGTAATAFGKLMQQKSMRDVPVRMINRLASQHAVLAHADVQAAGPSVRGRIAGESFSKMIAGIAKGIERSLGEARIVRSMNQMKIITIGLTSYARDNGGVFPAKLSELNKFKYLNNLEKLMTNPRGDGWGYAYVKPREKLSELFKNNKLGTTAILMETRHGRVDPIGMVIYVGGRVSRPDQ